MPASVLAAFPGVDLKDVVVVRDSKRAQEAGVAAFTEGNVIHVAPGQYSEEVLRHEAAHCVQQKKGKKEGPSEGDREQEAEAAEKGGQVETARLGAAVPGKRQNKATKGAYRNNSKKDTTSYDQIPKAEISFSGGKLQLEGVSGSHEFANRGLYWPGKTHDVWKKLFRWNQFWPIPVFTAAGLNVELDVAARAGLGLSGSINYGVSRDESNNWVASLSGIGKLFASVDVAATLTGGVDSWLVR